MGFPRETDKKKPALVCVQDAKFIEPKHLRAGPLPLCLGHVNFSFMPDGKRGRPNQFILAEPYNRHTAVAWVLGSVCNYKCSYCRPDLNAGGNAFPKSLAPIKKFLLELKAKHSGREVIIELMGGEPTYWSQLDEFLEWSSEQKILVDMTSNGSRDPDWWSQYSSKLNMVGLSFHWEFADPKKFGRVLAALTKKRAVFVHVMATPGKVVESLALAQEWTAAMPQLSVNLKPVRKDFGEEFLPYTESEWDMIHKNPVLVSSGFDVEKTVTLARRHLVDENGSKHSARQVILRKWNRFKGWRCAAGLENIYIDGDGQIYRATCMMGGPIGHLSQGEWQLPDDWIICGRDNCHCQMDVYISKELGREQSLPQHLQS